MYRDQYRKFTGSYSPEPKDENGDVNEGILL